MRQIQQGICVLRFHFPPTIAVDGKRDVSAATPVAAARPNTTGAEKYIESFAYQCGT